MGLWNWSTTAANNATADPSINWQEGQAPSTVNDSARAMMAAVAVWYQAAEWMNLGDTPTYVSATQFTVTGNRTTTYSVGRRVKASVTAGTIYGAITASAYTSLTTITVAWDSGSLDSGLSEVDVGILNPLYSSFPRLSTGIYTQGRSYFSNSGSNNGEIALQNSGGGYFFLRGRNSGGCEFVNNAYSASVTSLDDTGNFTTAGTVSGSNITGTSDRRLKSHIKRIRNATDVVLSWVGVTFQRKGDKTKRRHAGFIANEMQSSAPELVFEDDKGIKSIAYGNATAYLAEAFKELEARVKKLEKKQ